MKIGLYGLHRGASTDPTLLAARARRAEQLGFESLWVGDHIALPADSPDPATEPRLEALTALTYLAAVTSTVRLGVGVLVLPQRQPVLLAKQLASIDRLSAGRLIVGGGVGYVEAELAAFGVTLPERADRTDESLAVIRALWNHEPAFTGRFTSYHDVSQHPAPQQAGGPPIILGGHAPPALARAARSADGWFGWGLSPSDAARYVSIVRALLAEHQRPTDDFEITVVPDDHRRPDLVGTYAEAGVDRLVLVASTTPDDLTDATIDLGASLL